MKATEIKKGIYWVGAIDWNVRDFHGYSTSRGTTYNAYLVVGKKVALVDTVKHDFADEMFERIKDVIPIEKIDYIIANHVEMDHSGTLPKIMEMLPDAKLVCSAKGAEGFEKTYQKNWKYEVVKTGDTIDLGGKTLTFIEAPMLHWPDSMFTYVKGDKVLLPNDGFGQHIATSQRFDDEVDMADIWSEYQKYYANILWPFSSLIAAMLKKITELKLDIEIIGPSHGIIWRKHIPEAIKKYEQWSSGYVKNKIVITYDTMWESTQKMAKEIAEGVRSEGVEVKLLRLRLNHRSDIIKEALEAKAILIGTPTLNNTIYPTVAELLTYIRGLRPQKKIWHAFGSYGWGGGGVEAVEKEFKDCAYEFESSKLKVQYVPTDKELKECFVFGAAFAKKSKRKNNMTKTDENLKEAFAGESMARNKYDYFAKVARKEGYHFVASLFEETALNEMQHAKDHFKFMKGIGSTTDNLKAAIEGEHYENTQMYPTMAKEAREDGEEEIALKFENISKVEEKHEKRYRKLLKMVEEGTIFKSKKPIAWKCSKCGYIHVGNEPPEKCPSCAHPRGYFGPESLSFVD
ncbi:MAG: rubrerythrin [Candidatus Altiarchaeota archaeon]